MGKWTRAIENKRSGRIVNQTFLLVSTERIINDSNSQNSQTSGQISIFLNETFEYFLGFVYFRVKTKQKKRRGTRCCLKDSKNEICENRMDSQDLIKFTRIVYERKMNKKFTSDKIDYSTPLEYF